MGQWRSKKSGEHFPVQPGKGKGPQGPIVGPEPVKQQGDNPDKIQQEVDQATEKFQAAKTDEERERVIEETQKRAERLDVEGHSMKVAPDARFTQRKNEELVQERVKTMKARMKSDTAQRKADVEP